MNYRDPMRIRPRASLGRILDDLGTTVLDVAASPGDLDAEVTGVHIYDPLDELIVPEGAMVLAVGVQGAADVCALLARVPHAAGVVVKLPVDVDERVRAAVLETGVAVLGLTRAASWAQVAALVRSLLAEGDLAEPGEGAHGDLFALANAVCALLDAPVTIEDRSSRVLAFSGRQEEADQGRVETVLGRQVPERYLRLLDEQGAFKRLYQNREPVYIELHDGSVINRVAVAVRAGDEILGSIWAAVHEPLTPQRQRALADAAKVVALRLLHERAGADTQRRLRADLLSTVLAGGADAAEAAGRLGIATARLCVLAAELTGPPGDGARTSGHALDRASDRLSDHLADYAADHARSESERQRFCDALALHVAAIHPKAAAALAGSVAYAVLPLTPGGGEEERAVRVAESFLARVGPPPRRQRRRRPARAQPRPGRPFSRRRRPGPARAAHPGRQRAGRRLHRRALRVAAAPGLRRGRRRGAGPPPAPTSGCWSTTPSTAPSWPPRWGGVPRRVRRRQPGRRPRPRAPQHLPLPAQAAHRDRRARPERPRRPAHRATPDADLRTPALDGRAFFRGRHRRTRHGAAAKVDLTPHARLEYP
ncbi:hypothetical protein GCM10020001_089850 [Nonomuraea salmonea]